MTSIRLLRDVSIPLRDGVRTSAEVWLPDDRQAHPALLVRTPYLKEVAASTGVVDSRLATARGYAVVLQDVRGRGDSEGSFDPFVDEEADGFDTVAWVADQAWCDGRVVMSGMSYVGATQWLTAVGAPPALAGIAPALSSDDYSEGWSYTAGVPELGFLTSWSAVELVAEGDRMLDDPAQAWNDVPSAHAVTPWLRDWLEGSPGSDYWRARSVSHRRDELRVPALIVGGWYDVFLAASLRSFARSRDRRDRLIVGPWCHDEMLSHIIGEANAGIAGLGSERVPGWILDFYDAVLSGRDPDSPRVRGYVLGARRWLDLDSWPPAGTTTARWPIEPGAFAVDPDAPVPSRGGRALLVYAPGWGYGVVDQRPLVGRADVHVAARVVLDRDTLLAGALSARLRVAAAGDRDADCLWVATLCAEQPGGELHNLAEGVARAARDAERVDVDLGHTMRWLPAGSTLVLLVAGSSFPRWPKPAVGAEQRVLAGSELEVTIALELDLA